MRFNCPTKASVDTARMSARATKYLAVIILAIGLIGFGAPAQVVRPSTQTPTGEELLGVTVRMRDGVHLAADVFLPKATGRWPTVLVRTPYNRKAFAMRSYQIFVQNGYALVVQDVRGRYGSQGVFGDIRLEGPDGNDTINWIAEQPWSNGRVAMAGSSYLGVVQWWAAVQENPHLRAISPMVSGDDEYLDRYYSTGGALKLGHRLLWLAQNLTPPSETREPFSAYIGHLPERTSDVAATGEALSLWRGALSHPSYDAYWESASIREKIGRVSAPVLSFGGWFDNYAESDLDAFSRLSREHKTIETWIGPWGHNSAWKFPTRDFGPQATLRIRPKQLEWFDEQLSGEPTHAAPLLHIFVMGPNVWREEHEWPLARTHYTPLFLSSGGHANSSAGDGSLDWQPSRIARVDTFTYDPKDPVPTTGGAICCDPKVLPPGPLNQSTVEQRPDVLVYTSEPLKTDLEVTGPVKVVLYAATSANDSDFTAKLVDVESDRRPLLVTDGIQRLRYRLSLEKPVFVKRNMAYQITVNAGVTSYVFAAGHRIRLEVSSSNFPRFDRNLNSSGANADQTKPNKARQTLFHEKDYPSAIILPVIREEKRE
jgi:uncharacterized protein